MSISDDVLRDLSLLCQRGEYTPREYCAPQHRPMITARPLAATERADRITRRMFAEGVSLQAVNACRASAALPAIPPPVDTRGWFTRLRDHIIWLIC